MKKIFFALLFSASVFAMEEKRDIHSEESKRQYSMEYERARESTPESIEASRLYYRMACNASKSLCEEVLFPRLDAIQDVLGGKPNKFEKKP